MHQLQEHKLLKVVLKGYVKDPEIEKDFRRQNLPVIFAMRMTRAGKQMPKLLVNLKRDKQVKTVFKMMTGCYLRIKDSREPLSAATIYQIICKNTRFTKHKRHCRLLQPEKSAEHALEDGNNVIQFNKTNTETWVHTHVSAPILFSIYISHRGNWGPQKLA